MAKRVKRVGHPAATAATFVGREREFTADTSTGTVILHNGVTPGGTPLARADLVNSPAATPTTDGKATSVQVSQINQNTTDIAGLTNQINNLMAVSVGFDPASSSLTSDNVQAAIDELDTKVQGLSFTAANISYDNATSGLVATDVQAAIDEVAASLGTAAGLSKAQISDYAFAGAVKAVFVQAAAPLYWTIDPVANDRMLRVNSASGGGTGGAWPISGVTVDGHPLTIAELAAHTHDYTGGDFINGRTGSSTSDFQDSDNIRTLQTQSTGSGAAHSHGLTADGTWRPAYIDSLICTKDAPTQ